MKTPRIGIFAGTFNPVHAGHVTFALQALEAAKLDHLYFLPERQPRGKPGVEHFGHRVAMIRRALQPHPRLDVLELVDINFSVARTLPRLQQQFDSAQLVFLCGSDTVVGLPKWQNADQLLTVAELVVGVRSDDDVDELKKVLESWQRQPRALTVFTSYAPTISSSRIREALYKRQPARGLLKSVERYSDHHWLYVSVG